MLRITLVLFIVGEALVQLQSDSNLYLNSDEGSDFDFSRFLGKWYQLASYTNSSTKGSRPQNKCVTIYYKLAQKGTIEITITQTRLGGNRQLTTKLIARPVGNPREGEFTLSPTNAAYYVLKTDYISWAVAWSCTYSHGLKIITAGIYTRAKYSTHPVNAAAYAAAEEYYLHQKYFVRTIKEGCPKSY